MNGTNPWHRVGCIHAGPDPDIWLLCTSCQTEAEAHNDVFATQSDPGTYATPTMDDATVLEIAQNICKWLDSAGSPSALHKRATAAVAGDTTTSDSVHQIDAEDRAAYWQKVAEESSRESQQRHSKLVVQISELQNLVEYLSARCLELEPQVGPVYGSMNGRLEPQVLPDLPRHIDSSRLWPSWINMLAIVFVFHIIVPWVHLTLRWYDEYLS